MNIIKKIDWFTVYMIAVFIIFFVWFSLLAFQISYQRQQSMHFTNMFVEEKGDIPLSFFSLNRRGGIVWSNTARVSFRDWMYENEVTSRVRINLLDQQARRLFNFGMFENMFDDE